MKVILLFINSLLFVVFLQSCTSGEVKNKAVEVPVAVNAKDEMKNAVTANVPIPDLYKGMADSPDNKLGGLKVGDTAPNIIGTTSDGEAFNLSEAIKNGPVGLVFYRGFWCGICTKHLDALEGEMAELTERGLQMYAITPENDEHIAKTKEKSTIQIPFIHDNAHKIMDDYKVTYRVKDDYAEKVEGFAKVGLAESQGADNAYLPVPATYLIGKDGKIFFAHYDHNYSNRATASEMVAALAAN